MDQIDKARLVASRYLTDRGYDAEARIIASGSGDDFAEVRIALHLLTLQDERLDRYERVLTAYADPEFWNDMADADQGRRARHALEGRDLPAQHYHD
jgi:hypothetical protein